MKKILVIRFSSIGDIVLTTPVVRCLKNSRPDDEIHYLTKAQNLSLLQNNHHITKIWLFRDNFNEIIPQLRAENFDFIIDLHKNIRSRYVISRLKKPSDDFPKLDFQKFLMVHAKIDLLPKIHIVDRYFRAVEGIGVYNDGKGLDFFISPEDEIDKDSLPLPFPAGYNAVVIGGKHNTKILPEEKVAEICNNLILPVILLGGPEDFERGERIRALCTRNVINTCGKYNICQSASLLKQAVCVITNDTGLMHIAAALKKPVVSVWGNTIPGFGMYPYYPAENGIPWMISEVKGLPCRPCSKLGFEKCPRGHFMCMRDQKTSSIIEFVNNIRV